MDVELKDALGAIRTSVGDFRTQQDAMQKQLDALDVAVQGGNRHAGSPSRGLKQLLEGNDAINRLMNDRRGKAVLNLKGADSQLLERKTVLTEIATGTGPTGTALAPVGFATSGVLLPSRIPGIVPEARQTLFVRDLLSSRPTTATLVDYVKVTSPMAIASPAPEASVKAENAVSFGSASERIKTIATWIPASKQVLDDMGELSSFIDSSLRYYLDQAEELQLLSGDGVGEDLHGLIPQATAFSTTLLGSSWTRMDGVARAIQQITVAKEIAPTFVVLHPTDWWNIRLQKDSLGHYILGDPQSTAKSLLFDLTVVATTNIAQGTFLVGSGSPVAAEIVDRMESVVEISTEHADFFTRNMVAIRAEKRLALIVKRPNSFVTGTFTTSPAGM